MVNGTSLHTGGYKLQWKVLLHILYTIQVNLIKLWKEFIGFVVSLTWASKEFLPVGNTEKKKE